MRSLKMFVFNGLEFQCVNTTCISYVNQTTEDVLKCRITCLSLLQCKAASFYQSTLVCQLFTDTSIQNANMLVNSNVISLIVQSETRIPPEPTTSTTSSTTSTTSSTTSTSTTTSVATNVLIFTGVQLDFNPSSLPSGWSLCYSATYATIMEVSSLSSILSSCNKNNLLLGCRPAGSVNLTVAAMGNRNDVLYNCGSVINCIHIANGVGWYYSDSYSWGFVSGGDTVTRSSCDTASTNANYRLCWHTNNNGGYRCGSTTDLNSDTSWDKVIYQSN
ncbi:unnamed protein product [Adineta ricciae]|uniref:Apple domain-containing protein n=1 Tax=Adineta ricciae TaxID=249248 RepID=A0A814YEN4_ADIRI|nr:unnamed protein product [Adineta ricciae]